jgi:2-amino-4-hydroxy-6-hydroxymethyldihydropteridine diphosphokinase
LSEYTKNIDAYIAVGANLGDRHVTIEKAIDTIARLKGTAVVLKSTLIETDPVGGPMAQGMYVNCAIKITTTLTADQLLASLLQIEENLGRVRTEKWAPRTIDLDLIFYGKVIIDEPHLQVPHPLMHLRAFVLGPMAEIAPRFKHPLLGESMQSLFNFLKEK